MKVAYNWLKDCVEIKISPQALADKLTMAGLEVTSLEEKDGDFVFEIEVTSNRPDCLSVIGIAREVAAITAKKLKSLHATRYTLHAKSLQPAACSVQPVSIKIEDKKDCPLYTAKIIKDAKAGSSPDWLKKRLELVGLRSVNNIVDITNYVLLELGEPLHAFDLDKLVLGFSGSRVLGLDIIVRRARKAEELTTIDGVKRPLDDNILIIGAGVNSRTRELANSRTSKPVALAGIMGGKDTEVTHSTKNILLEAAVFNPIIVRRARQALRLTSESAYRFERGVNPQIVEKASWRAAELIQELAAGKCVLAKSSRTSGVKSKIIQLNIATAQKILGIKITPAKIKMILNSLGFKLKKKARDDFLVGVPAHRADVNLEADLVEEIARIFGYENIPKSLPAVKPRINVGQKRDAVSLIKNILVSLGLNEVITYSLIDKELMKIFAEGEPASAIEILNPLSKEQGVLRPSLIPSLCQCVVYNLNQKQGYVNIFEVASVFSEAKSAAKEELKLGIALCGTRTHFFEQGLVKEDVGFLHLKGILKVLFARLGIKDYSFNTQDTPAINIYVKQEKIGTMSGLRKGILDRINIKNSNVFVLELALDKVLSYVQLTKKFVAPAKYPGIARDISFILKEDISVKEVLEAIQEKGGALLRNIEIVDYYKGKQIPSGYKGLTISCFYRCDERTLAEIEINPMHSQVCSVLIEKFAAKVR